ncbi:PilC/PilY family type IV pilus protein [Xanthomonas campestris pv. campestris]|nr:PilC/PilY family type IV pilus protein [Xanthomonas campestris]MEB1414752.1 PilC/PilY family type IV pilus protein [Xanthomonas campestris pv. campestris]MEB1460436.1 PilC/PilY family type IV pilus protein [Xanthomonas campestris pv. campestris]MEB1501557.1 PilC/PilY family type IV pilus protein [Xanthomonas campestris pv. campestris]MEB1525836.1 PilC/PilY family type IV pilus protein [Xanthomonas campestris pv. campestris]MEB1586501.1 PilC/PilY family type IV pilus protein [Xanthomonas cam
MSVRRYKLRFIAFIAVVALCSYGIYVAFSAQGQGRLAQAPLNTQTTTRTAFIMAVDDSNSMGFEVLTALGDLNLRWNNCSASFFSGSGVFFPGGASCTTNVGGLLYLFPHAEFDKAYGGDAIAPLDQFGFARSPVYNKTYFDPAITYDPWRKADGTEEADAVITAARADPRPGRAVTYGVTYNLTQNRTSTSEGFYIPVNTVVQNLAGTGVRYRFNQNWSTAARTFDGNSGNANYAFDYFPATFYLPAASPAPAGYRTANVNRPVVVGGCGSGCDLRRYQIKSENYNDIISYNLAIQNFANWFQYHRNRTLAMIGSMTQSLISVNTMNIGYFTINARNDVTMYKMPDERASLYAAITTLTLNGGTPNRSAVSYLGEQFRRVDAGAPVISSCQKNAGMLFTDGYTNNTDDSSVANEDELLGQPFADVYSGTIADIAASYYSGTATPLRTGGLFAAGNVKVPDECATLAPTSVEWKRLDCETDLHMNFYGITLGAQGRIYEVNAAATADPFLNPPNWSGFPNPSTVDDGTVVDELWHATINSRGGFVNAKTPDEVTVAMRTILNGVASGLTPSGTVALTGSRIGAGSFTVAPSYNALNNSTDWFGRLKAQRVASASDTGEISYADLWEASAVIPAADARNIIYGTPSGAAVFNADNVSLSALCSNINIISGLSNCTAASIAAQLKVSAAQAVAYLRGDQTLETSNLTPLRSRTTRLGDIVNSSPVIEAATDDFGYRSMYDINSGKFDPYNYAGYLLSKASAGRSMVYAGANDGMLHGFNGRTGVEQFAYIPQSVLGHMGNLLFPYTTVKLNTQYAHRYYVDGPVVVSDVASAAGAWSTVLVGTTGAGGKSVFALDVSNPTGFNASRRLWEINDSNANVLLSANIGNVLGKPVIVPVRSSTGVVSWKAIFGNGYGSINGRAVLFVVDILSGRVNLLPAAESGVVAPNGLGNIVVVDRWAGSSLDTSSRDGFADTVYAADQLGAVWKFDLRNLATTAGAPELVATATTPLFVARDMQGTRQPILGGLLASAGAGGNVMLFFGTGAFSFEGDDLDSSSQTLYAVLDRGVAGVIQRGNLLQQSVVSSTQDSRVTTAVAMAAGRSGWYIDLPGVGERLVGTPAIANGIVFFPTFQPGSRDSCLPGGTNWLYGLDALSGAAQLSGVRPGSVTGNAYATGTGAVRLKTAGTGPVKDLSVITSSRATPLPPSASGGELSDALSRQCSMMIRGGDSQPLFIPRACGRQSWRQIK